MKFELNSKNLRLAMLAGLAFSVIVFFGVTVAGLGRMGQKSKQIVDLKVKSQTADSQLSNLEIAKKQVEKYSYFKDVAKTVIPSDKDQAQAVLQINQFANQSGIALQNITFPASSLGLTTSATGVTAQQDATTKSSTHQAITQAKPVSGIPGLYSLQLIITDETDNSVPVDKTATFPKMLDFMRRIENNRRTAQISDITIQPATNNSSLTFSLTVNIFIKP